MKRLNILAAAALTAAFLITGCAADDVLTDTNTATGSTVTVGGLTLEPGKTYTGSAGNTGEVPPGEPTGTVGVGGPATTFGNGLTLVPGISVTGSAGNTGGDTTGPTGTVGTGGTLTLGQ